MTRLDYLSNIPYELEKNKKLRNICYQSLKDKYCNQIPESVLERLKWELKMTALHQFSSYYLEIQEFIKRKNIQPWNMSFEGTVGTSFICYLCGITHINPLDSMMPLYSEFFMGYQGNKFPHFGMLTSDNDRSMKMLEVLVEKTSVYPTIEEISRSEDIFLLQRNVDSLPLYEKESAKSILEELKPRSLVELVKAVAVICSDAATVEISCREDVYEAVMDCGIDRKTAFCIAESTRRGLGIKTEWQVLLLQKGFSKEMLKVCNETKYLCSRAEATEIVLRNLRFLYFKMHFSDVYRDVCKMYGGKENNEMV